MFNTFFDSPERAAEVRAVCDRMIEVVRTQGPGWLSPVRDKAAVQRSLEHLVSKLRALRDGVPMTDVDAPEGDENEDDGPDIEEAGLDDTEDLNELAKRSLDACREDLRRLRGTREGRMARAVDREAERSQAPGGGAGRRRVDRAPGARDDGVQEDTRQPAGVVVLGAEGCESQVG